ncbi:MAG TPA: glycosyltransferase [Acidobacteriaceae bacterium]|jgi:hypothetical protein|nr:glycosyltransferase [Acidobacteriaceae bacterium]
MKPRKALYISPIDMWSENGIAHGQRQLLAAVCSVYDEVDVLSAGAPIRKARGWLAKSGFRVNLLQGFYPWLTWLNTMAWYGGGVILCNKLRWIDRFYFPLRTPLPKRWIEKYDRIVCYYAWHFQLLSLHRAGAKVVVDTSDVMADRHERIGTRRWISLTAADEGALLRSEARCLAVSQDDAAEFQRIYGVRPQVLSFVPQGSAELIAVASGERPRRLGFMGAPSYVNEEILRLLARREFLETLTEAGIELLIAGGICATADAAILRSLERQGARILGRVESAAEYYAQIGATVNPVGPSTGVKIKSVETLVAGRSLITTQWGADANLAAAFPGQVAYIDWPMGAGKLGKLCTQVVLQAPQVGSVAGEAYVLNATRALEEMLKP